MNDIKCRNKDTKVSLIAMDLVLVLIGIFNYKLILFDCWAKCNSKFKPFLNLSSTNKDLLLSKQTDEKNPPYQGDYVNIKDKDNIIQYKQSIRKTHNTPLKSTK